MSIARRPAEFPETRPVVARRPHQTAGRYRTLPVLLLLLLSALLAGSGCSAPKRAQVVSREATVTPKKASRPLKPPAGYYRVKRGDTLYSIAWRLGIDFPSLAAWNGIRSPYTIYPGQRLRLSRPPARSRSAAKARKGSAGRTARSTPPKVRKRRKTESTRVTRRSSTPAKAAAGSSRLQWQWPTSGTVVQRFKADDPGRKGIKIRGRSGQKIAAAEAGKVVYAGSGLIGYGRLIIIKHNKNYLSAYGHNRKLLVREGATVRRGQPVAEMGQNGSGQSLLHFEIRRNGIPVDPVRLLPRRN